MIVFDGYNNIFEFKGIGKKLPASCSKTTTNVEIGKGKKVFKTSFLFFKGNYYLKTSSEGNYILLDESDYKYLTAGNPKKVSLDFTPFYDSLKIKIFN